MKKVRAACAPSAAQRGYLDVVAATSGATSPAEFEHWVPRLYRPGDVVRCRGGLWEALEDVSGMFPPEPNSRLWDLLLDGAFRVAKVGPLNRKHGTAAVTVELASGRLIADELPLDAVPETLLEKAHA